MQGGLRKRCQADKRTGSAGGPALAGLRETTAVASLHQRPNLASLQCCQFLRRQR